MNDITEKKYVAHVNFGIFSEKVPIRLKYYAPMTQAQIQQVIKVFDARYVGWEQCGIWEIYLFDAAKK